MVIHEFDPWFNYRATEYLYYNGWERFCTWFDYKSWYPLGRPVGTTIYPGLQLTAVFLKNHIFTTKSLNDICCLMPAWFGAVASFFVGLMAYESAYSAELERKQKSPSFAMECGIAAAGIMAIVPAHLMRSIGGGFDNESLAFTTMTGTYYFWCRSIRDEKSWPIGILTGIMYFYMVAVWGGYIFVLNMVGCHAGFLVLLGRYSTGVYRSYSLFFFVGTFLSIYTLPVVGWAPLKSLEQMGPLLVFLVYQLIEICEIIKRKKGLNQVQAWELRFRVLGWGLLVSVAVGFLLTPSGYFGPLSARVRGLLVKHTRTGNPLVDSVAEHQPASSRAYMQYMGHLLFIAPVGLNICFWHFTNASTFLVLYAFISYYFSSKMVRFIILLGPGMSALGGIAVGHGLSWSFKQFLEVPEKNSVPPVLKKNKKGSLVRVKYENGVQNKKENEDIIFFKKVMAGLFFFLLYQLGPKFYHRCHK